MRHSELWEILVSLSANEISLADAHTQIMVLMGEKHLPDLCDVCKYPLTREEIKIVHCMNCGEHYVDPF